MAGFAWGAAGAGAARALSEIQEARRQKEVEDARLALQREQQGLLRQQLMEQLGASKETRERNRRDQQLQEAQIALGQAETMGQGAEVSPDITKLVMGTPYAARLDQKSTLPSRTVAVTGVEQSDPGGRAYSTIRPTAVQQREQGQRTELARVASDPSVPPTVRRQIDLYQRTGVHVPNPESFELPTERDARVARDRDSAFGDFSRRTDYSAGVTEAARRRALEDPVTPRDRRDALRLADAAAADYLSSVNSQTMGLPEGIDPEAIRQQFRDEYLAIVERRPAPGHTRRTVEGLSRIVAAPTRTGSTSKRLMVDVMPRGGSGTPAGGPPASSDPYEQYLARTGGR